jgi:hypothetical protein
MPVAEDFMKIYVKYDMPDDKEDFELAQKAVKMSIAIDDMWNEVFRPFYKHGYKNKELNDLTENEDVAKAIDLLAEIYREVLRDNGLYGD